MVLIILMALTNCKELMQIAETVSFLLLCLCDLAYYCGMFLGRLFGLNGQQQRTLGIETGIRNAGIAMIVAATLIDRPALAMIALFYGIGMNLPALLIIVQISWRKSAAYKTN